MSNIESTKGEIVMYQPDETIRLEVRVESETVWLNQAQMAELFGTKRPAITKHLNNIYKCEELSEESTCSILEHMGNDGKQLYSTKYYNLDAIISVGFRVSSSSTCSVITSNIPPSPSITVSEITTASSSSTMLSTSLVPA